MTAEESDNGAPIQPGVTHPFRVSYRFIPAYRPVPIHLRVETDRIEAGQVGVIIRQEEAVTKKISPRTLIAAIYVGEERISHEAIIVCSQTSVNPRDNYFRVILAFPYDKYKGQMAELRLYEPEGTSQRRLCPEKVQFKIARTFFGAQTICSYPTLT